MKKPDHRSSCNRLQSGPVLVFFPVARPDLETLYVASTVAKIIHFSATHGPFVIAIGGTSFCRLLHLRPTSTSGLAHKRSLAVPFLLDCHSTFCNVMALCECYWRYFILSSPPPSASTSPLVHKASL